MLSSNSKKDIYNEEEIHLEWYTNKGIELLKRLIKMIEEKEPLKY